MEAEKDKTLSLVERRLRSGPLNLIVCLFQISDNSFAVALFSTSIVTQRIKRVFDGLFLHHICSHQTNTLQWTGTWGHPLPNSRLHPNGRAPVLGLHPLT